MPIPDEEFFAVETETFQTSAGPCDLPILYRKAKVIGLVYRLNPALVAECLPDDCAFEPHLLMGKAVVQLVVFEYTDTSIGPYAEVALAVQVKVKGSDPPGLGSLLMPRMHESQGSFFLTLPVTTEEANAAGRELWGFPKYVVEIDTEFTKKGVSVKQHGEFTLEVGPPGWMTTDGMPFCLMSVKGGRILRTIVETNHRLEWGGSDSVKLEIIGDGPTSKHLRTLKLEDKTPNFTWRARKMRSQLPKADLIGEEDEGG